MRSRCGLLLSVLLSAVPLFAQFSGRVAGTVIDSSGAVVPDAQVDLYMAAGKKPLLSTRTANNGAYNFLAVRPADYDLTVEAKGFVKYTLHGLTVDAARETSVPQVKLQLASVAETVEVSGDAQGVEVNNAEIADTVFPRSSCNWLRWRRPWKSAVTPRASRSIMPRSPIPSPSIRSRTCPSSTAIRSASSNSSPAWFRTAIPPP